MLITAALCCLALQDPVLGQFTFQSHKQERLHNVHQGRCRAYMFIMHVEEELQAWPEFPDRQRCWVSAKGNSTSPGSGAVGGRETQLAAVATAMSFVAPLEKGGSRGPNVKG